MKNFWRLVTKSRIRFSLAVPDDFGLEEISDSVLASNGKTDLRRRSRTLWRFYQTISSPSQLRKFNWAYGNESAAETDAIHKLYLPLSHMVREKDIGKLCPELEVLSLDIAWLPFGETQNILQQLYQGNNGIGLKLSSLAKLEQLYLPEGMPIPDFRFLKDLASLRHLQIDLSSNSLAQGGGQFSAATLPSLESLTLFYEPDRFLVNELAKLPSLKKITIVDRASLIDAVEFKTLREQLKRKLGGQVEVQIIAAADVAQTIPEDFKQHAKKVRQQIREKYLSE